MILGIDASNIRRGGGVTHLVELLRAGDPERHGFHKVIVWSSRGTLNQIEDRTWLEKAHLPVFESNLIKRSLWQRRELSDAARAARCDLLFVPGSSFAGNFRPMVTLSQNLLPFELKELFRFGFSAMTLKLIMLRGIQSRTFKRAQGLIFLTDYAKSTIMRKIKKTRATVEIIPHGIEARFKNEPKLQRAFGDFSFEKPFKVIYVSIIDVYKHQDSVVLAVKLLRDRGLPVELSLVGPSYGPALKKLQKILTKIEDSPKFVEITGAIPYLELHKLYLDADLCLFASSCENLPIILLEGMASGLPIASSNMGPMPEVLKDAGLYFDPENPKEIALSIETYMRDAELRNHMAQKSFELTKAYSWHKTSDLYFDFFGKIGK